MLTIFSIISISSHVALAQPQPIGEYKPDIDDLIYTFTSEYTADPVTTDYVASLPRDENEPGDLFSKVIYFALILANVFAFLSFIIAGLFMVMAQGEDEEMTKAKKIFTYTVIAMVVCAGALALVTGLTKLNYFKPV